MNFNSRASAVALLLEFCVLSTRSTTTSHLYAKDTQFDGYTCSSEDVVEVFDSVRSTMACIVRCKERGCLDVFYYPATRKCLGCYTFHSSDLYPGGNTGGSLHYKPVLDCPWSFVRYNTSCYKMTTSKMPWESAQSECASENAYLAIIDDAMENNFIEIFLDSIAATLSDDKVYFGLTDSQEEGTWRTVHGDTQTFSNWAIGQPDNGFITYSKMINEDCATIKTSSKKWHDKRCKGLRLAICEMDLI